MTSYRAPLRDMRFVLNEVIDLAGTLHDFGQDEVQQELIDAVLEEGARLAQETFAPLNRIGDEQGLQWNQGVVTTPEGFQQAYRNYCANGWSSMTAPVEFGGQGLPVSLAGPIHEMCAAANLSLRTYCGLTEGAVATIHAHAEQSLKDLYLPKMIDGSWSGTMCLTEPHAGTDLGILRTSARPNGDGSYAVTGNKIFITGGEHDLSANIVHLVLARLPDAPLGSRGISLFLVPKFLPGADGEAGERNGVYCEAVEHKMGLRASATAALRFDNAQAWLVGEANRGLACMFTMMNDARFDVGIQGLGVAEMSFQGSVAYARERLQTRSLTGAKQPDKPADPIIVHPDVRRMLLTQKALIEGSRMLACQVATLIDGERFSSDPEQRKAFDRQLAFYTPIVKAFLTDMTQEVTSLGVQVHGGHGYIKEMGMEQLVRDARILPIWEGTNGIQALDLVRRKIIFDDAAVLNGIIDEVLDFCAGGQGPRPDAAKVESLARLARQWRKLGEQLLAAADEDAEEIGARSVDFLQFSGYLLLAWCWARMAGVARVKIESGAGENEFYTSKLATADFYFDRILPRAQAHRAAMVTGAANLMRLSAGQFAFL